MAIPAGDDAVAAAVALARDFTTGCGLDEDASARLAIIVEELVCNLVDHGGLGPDQYVHVELWRSSGGVTLVLNDTGPPFDPRSAAPPGELPPDRGGGAGLALVRAWAKIDSYTRIDGCNRLSITMTV